MKAGPRLAVALAACTLPACRLAACALPACALVACTLPPDPIPSCGPAPLDDDGLALQGYRIVDEHPHDPDAFTQGLVHADGQLYESTGLYGASTLRRVSLETGAVEQQIALDDELWGEGLALSDDRLVQLTWKAGRALRYATDGLEPLDERTYETEGWGLATVGDELVMSDGSSTLVFRDPNSFEETRRVEVTSRGVPVPRLNELELVNGEIWANVWPTEQIARIDPETGRVLGWVLFTGLGEALGVTDSEDVLNGIAFDPAGCRLFITGKRWPTLFEVEVR